MRIELKQQAKQQLVALLRRRQDGYWVLLATAAGQTAAVERSMNALTPSALDAHFNEPASYTLLSQTWKSK